jgi:starch synthase (maltosyl-transferring)
LKDVITGDSFVWRGSKNFVRLDPARAPGHMFIVKRI